MKAKTGVCAAMLCTLLTAGIAAESFAAEGAKCVYLLGKAGPTAGIVPKQGIYVKDDLYYYSGDSDELIPTAGRLVQDVEATAFINLLSATWVTGTKIAGGTLSFGALLPYGYQDVKADFEFTGPRGNVFATNQEDDVTSIGDPVLNAALGWHSGMNHWNTYVAMWIPVGDYEQGRIANMGTNRWAGDIGAGYTRLNPKSGLEISGTAGFTCNAENDKTDYQTGTELHVEAAVIQHLANNLSAGIAGYFYKQLSGDSGDGAVLGDFKGRTAAIGPVVGYTFRNGLSLNMRWYHEFAVENRIEGDAIFATLTVPFTAK